MVQIVKQFIKRNQHYTNYKVIPVRTLVLHSVGCPQPNPKVFVNSWNSPSVPYVTQLVVGIDTAYEVLPCMQTKGKAYRCYHVGTANSYSIGVEMTEPSTIKYTQGSQWIDLNPSKTKAHVLATYETAVDVFAQLCIFHGIDPLSYRAILSHKECHDLGIGTNHGDVEHIWDKYGLTMNQFRKDVKAKIKSCGDSVDILAQKGVINTPDYWKNNRDKIAYLPKLLDSLAESTISTKVNDFTNVEQAIQHIADCGVINTPEYWLSNHKKVVYLDSLLIKSANRINKDTSFQVKVDIENLNMRTGPAKSYDRIAYIPKGIYTIVETKDEWGRLKAQQSYKGESVDAWIHLDYVTRL